MDPKLLELLGLTEDATPEQITEAITKLKAGPAAELETVKTELAEARAKLAETELELANARNANPELTKFVPRAEYDAVKARNMELEGEKVATAKEAHDKAVEAEIDAALKAGKVTPSCKDYYVGQCATAEGLEAFRSFLKGAPVVGDPSDLDDRPAPGTGEPTVTEAQLAIAANCGLTKDQYLAAARED